MSRLVARVKCGHCGLPIPAADTDIWFAPPNHACAVHPVGVWQACCSAHCALVLYNQRSDTHPVLDPTHVVYATC